MVPNFKRNLIYVSCLLEQSSYVLFNVNKVFICKEGVEICLALLENILFVLKLLVTKAILNAKLFKTTHNKHTKGFSKRKYSTLTSKIKTH